MSAKTDLTRVSIVRASPENACELARLHAALFGEIWSSAGFAGLLGRPGAMAFLARHGEPAETVGFIVGHHAAGEAEILTLGVRRDRQRLGIGRRLVEALIGALKCAEARQLFLEVAVGNAAACTLYRKLGFEEVGRRKEYYRRPPWSPGEDAVVLALRL
jgi:ribosomal-protein-alanine N-acetyltransferase